ncbi:MAG TPA: hypothetical protein VKZ60_09145 [Chloroflexota bacterium]|jgi:hypothetical protein|nr:hypothetical protein [Chloroflexota bacterium]
MPYRLRLQGSDTVIGLVADEQLARLAALLATRRPQGRDDYLDEATLDYLAEQGEEELVLLLGPFVTPGAGVALEWEPVG